MSKRPGVYILCSGDTRIEVFKAVLLKQSGYVRSMRSFLDCSNETDQTETRDIEIKLDNLGGDVLQTVAEFVQNGDVSLDMATVASVFMAADYLDIPALVGQCETFLKSHMKSHMTIDNFEDILNMADQLNMVTLSDICCNFIACNFYRLSKSQIIHLSDEQMKKCLADDNLHIDSELQLIIIVKMWLKYNKGLQNQDYYRPIDVEIDAWKTFIALMTEIRWPLIKQKDMKTIDSWIMYAMTKIPECSELLREAADYHADVYQQPLKQSRRTQVRNNGASVCFLDQQDPCKLTAYNIHSRSEHDLTVNIEMPLNCNVISLNNFLYVCGGWNLNRSIRACRRYDPRFNSWNEMSPILTYHLYACLVAHGNRLYIIGGLTQDCECFDIKSNKWHRIANIEKVRCHATCVLNDSIYVSGGFYHNTYNTYKQCLYRYDVNTNTQEWQKCADMIQPRACHTMETVGQLLYVIGGWSHSGSHLGGIDQYSPQNDQWTQCIHEGVAEKYPMTFVSGDKIYVLSFNRPFPQNRFTNYKTFDVTTNTLEPADPPECLPLCNSLNLVSSTLNFPLNFWTKQYHDVECISEERIEGILEDHIEQILEASIEYVLEESILFHILEENIECILEDCIEHILEECIECILEESRRLGCPCMIL